MTYDEKQMIFTGAATPEESAALALHYEIATAARAQAEKALEAEKAARQQAEANAEELAKQLKVVGDEDTLRFSLLFDRVQGDVDEVLTLCDELRGDGKTEKAGKFSAALRKALESMAEAIETEE